MNTPIRWIFALIGICPGAFGLGPLVLPPKHFYQVVIDGVPATIQASSELATPFMRFRADNILDGDSSTAWLADTLDPKPWIRISFSKKIHGRGVGVQFGWRKNWYTYLETEGPFPQRNSRELVVDNKRIGFFQGSLESESTGKEIPFSYLNSLGHQMARKDVIPFDFDGSVVELNGVSSLSEVKILVDDSLSLEYYPTSLESLFGSTQKSELKKVQKIQDFCEIRDTGVFGRLLTLNHPDSVVTLCSPLLKTKNKFDNFWRTARASFSKRAAYFLIPGSSGNREIWLQRFPWEVEWGSSEEYEAPTPLGVQKLNEYSQMRFSFPVVLISGQGKIESIRVSDGLRMPISQCAYSKIDESRELTAKNVHRENDTIGKRIGSQVWMRWNLVKSSRDRGSLCLGVKKSDTGWNGENCTQFGRFYRYSDAMQVCPKGWHLPERKEWIELLEYIRKIDSNVLSLSGASIRLLGLDSRMGQESMVGFDPYQFNARLALPMQTYSGFESPAQINDYFDYRQFAEVEFQSASPGRFGCPVNEETGRSLDQFVHSRNSFALWPSETPKKPSVDSFACAKLDLQIIEHKIFRVRNDVYLPVRCVKNDEKGD